MNLDLFKDFKEPYLNLMLKILPISNHEKLQTETNKQYSACPTEVNFFSCYTYSKTNGLIVFKRVSKSCAH